MLGALMDSGQVTYKALDDPHSGIVYNETVEGYESWIPAKLVVTCRGARCIGALEVHGEEAILEDSATFRGRKSTYHEAGWRPTSDPVQEAVNRAEQYWGNIPCAGRVDVAMGQRSEVTFVDPEHEVAAWATFTGAAGPNSVAASPSTYRDCIVRLNPNIWADRETEDDNFEALCQLMTHELGHFEGYADAGAKPGTIQYVFPDTAPLVTTCQHYDLVYVGDHFRSEAEETSRS